MIKDRFTESMANIMLRQMGAVEILNKPAYINKVKFKLSDGSNVTYINEIKEAVTSKIFEQYQRMAKGMEDMNSELEKMFMSRETSREDLDRIEKSIVDIYNDMRSLKKNSAVDMEELEKALNID